MCPELSQTDSELGVVIFTVTAEDWGADFINDYSTQMCVRYRFSMSAKNTAPQTAGSAPKVLQNTRLTEIKLRTRPNEIETKC